MKKKIKDLTLEEVFKICKTHLSCADCPLLCSMQTEDCQFCGLDSYVGFMGDDEVETKE